MDLTSSNGGLYFSTINGTNLDQIIGYLNLSSISQLSMTCRFFNQYLTNPEKLKKNLHPQDLQYVKVYFFKKYFSQFEIEHLFEFNYRKITRQELQNMARAPESTLEIKGMVKVAELFKSHQLLFELVQKDKELCASYKEQGSYCHLIENSKLKHNSLELQDMIHQIENKEIPGEISQAFINIFDDPKKLVHEDDSLDFKRLDLLVNDDFKLQLTHPDLAIKAYTIIWRKYSVKCLDSSCSTSTRAHDIFQSMTTPMFQGFCNAISLNSVTFAAFKNWYLTENQLKAWNEAFKNRKIESLTVCLYDTKFSLTTLTTFAELICKQDKNSKMVVYMRVKDNETVNRFLSLQSKIKEKNPEWIWKDEELTHIRSFE